MKCFRRSPFANKTLQLILEQSLLALEISDKIFIDFKLPAAYYRKLHQVIFSLRFDAKINNLI